MERCRERCIGVEGASAASCRERSVARSPSRVCNPRRLRHPGVEGGGAGDVFLMSSSSRIRLSQPPPSPPSPPMPSLRCTLIWDAREGESTNACSADAVASARRNGSRCAVAPCWASYLMREIEGDRGRFIRGTRYTNQRSLRSLRSLRSTQRLSKREHLNSDHPFGGIRATWALKEGLQRGNQTQSDAIRRNQKQSSIRATWALKEGRRTHSTSPWAAASVTGAEWQILAPSAQPASGGAARPPASRQRASASKAALACNEGGN